MLAFVCPGLLQLHLKKYGSESRWRTFKLNFPFRWWKKGTVVKQTGENVRFDGQ